MRALCARRSSVAAGRRRSLADPLSLHTVPDENEPPGNDGIVPETRDKQLLYFMGVFREPGVPRNAVCGVFLDPFPSNLDRPSDGRIPRCQRPPCGGYSYCKGRGIACGLRTRGGNTAHRSTWRRYCRSLRRATSRF